VTDQPLASIADQLEALRIQLDWVREYL